jgi:hypothetical protein
LNESSSLISKDIKEKCDKCYIKYGYNSKEWIVQLIPLNWTFRVVWWRI